MNTITRFLRSRSTRFLAALACLVPSLAHAHVAAGSASGFPSGLGHPFHGLDHLLAMLAVGVWAAQLGGRATWVVPASFVSVMALGGIMALTGIAMPFVEQGILVSVLLLGLLIAVAAKTPLALSMMIVGVFALFHGHAHGTEMPATVSGFAYAIGFMASTALLHALGIGMAVGLQRSAKDSLVRVTGVAVLVAGVALCVV